MSLTTNPNDPALGHGSDNVPVPMNEKYLVLSDEELAKGFVRPFRDKHIHVGRSVCAKMRQDGDKRLGGPRHVCTLSYQHAGGCGNFQQVVQPEHARMLNTHRIGGCGVETVMGEKLSATYACKPKFYGSTYCCGCSMHRPVAEFVWSADNQVVGS